MDRPKVLGVCQGVAVSQSRSTFLLPTLHGAKLAQATSRLQTQKGRLDALVYLILSLVGEGIEEHRVEYV